MSQAARRFAPAPAPAPARPARRPELRPVPRSRSRPAPRRSFGFALLAVAVLGMLILGLAFINVLVAQSSFRIDELTRKADRLSEKAQSRRLTVARLSTPERMDREARKLGLRPLDPDDVIYLDPEAIDPAAGHGDGSA
jgi:hypothetical protein